MYTHARACTWPGGLGSCGQTHRVHEYATAVSTFYVHPRLQCFPFQFRAQCIFRVQQLHSSPEDRHCREFWPKGGKETHDEAVVGFHLSSNIYIYIYSKLNIYIYICICMYLYIYICEQFLAVGVFIYIHIHTHIYVYVCMYLHIYMHIAHACNPKTAIIL